jgi:hypothetical protein
MKKNSTLLVASVGLFFAANAQTAGDYRSNVASGNWSAVASWQRFDGTAWVAAPSAPTTTDGVISILTGNTIIADATIAADQIVVDAGGILSIISTLNLADGAGDDLTVNGTCNWSNGTLGGPGNCVVAAAAGTLNITTGSNKFLNANLTNNVIISWQDEGVFHNAISTVTNNGTLNISGTANNSWSHLYIH